MKYIKLSVGWNDLYVVPVEDLDFPMVFNYLSDAFKVKEVDDATGVSYHEEQVKNKGIEVSIAKDVRFLTDRDTLLQAVQDAKKQAEQKSSDWYKEYTKNQQLEQTVKELQGKVEALLKVQVSCPSATPQSSPSLDTLVEQINENNISF